jgi:CRP/FNR family cyclic AMP-dependent transcriptional regulator
VSPPHPLDPNARREIRNAPDRRRALRPFFPSGYLRRAAIEWPHPGSLRPGAGVENVPLPFLSVGELLRGLPEPDVAKFRAGCSERRFPKDATVFLQGDPSDGACILKEGLVKVVSLSERGTDRILHILRPGDVFGELVLIDEPRPFTAIALTDAVVAVLPPAKLRDLLAASPGLSRNYLRLLSLRLHEVERSFPTLVHLWPHHRLAKELLHLAEDLGDETPKGTRMALRLTHEDLSNLIGASRETVTLLLHKFEEMGLVWREGRDLFLHRQRLADYLTLK